MVMISSSALPALRVVSAAVVPDGLTKETQRGGSSIPLCRQQEVACLAGCIDRPVQIFPLVFDFDVGFIHPPAATHWRFMPPERFI